MAKEPRKCKDCEVCAAFGDFGRCNLYGNDDCLVGLENRACKKFVPKRG